MTNDGPAQGFLSRVKVFLSSNPWYGGIGIFCSIISIPLGAYFFAASQVHPELIYYVHPAKTVIVKQGAVSALSVSINGAPVATDVTAAQVVIWNAGNQAVHGSEILSPIILRTDPATPILEATVLKSNRSEIAVTVDQAKRGVGEVELSWRILERGDAAMIQLVYAGSPSVNIIADGSVEGQPRIHLSVDRSTVAPGTLPTAPFAVALFASVFVALMVVTSRPRSLRRLRYFRTIIFLFAMGMIVLYCLSLRGHSPPPFDFS